MKTIILAAAFIGLVAAQNTTLTIDPNSVSLTERRAWCLGQQNTCTEVCGGPGRSRQNQCSPDQLTFACTCNDGTTPNVGEFSESLPAKVCQKWIEQCVDRNRNNLEGITACRDTRCGERNASSLVSPSSSSAAGSATPGPSSTGAATGTAQSAASGTAASSTPSSAAVVALELARNYGTGAFAAGVLALFGFIM